MSKTISDHYRRLVEKYQASVEFDNREFGGTVSAETIDLIESLILVGVVLAEMVEED